MYLDKMVKKDVILLIISVIFILILFIGISYSYFISFDKGKSNIISIGDLEITFCEDESCKSNYSNFGQVIGTKTINGESVAENIYPYLKDSDALNKMPYIFNIKNTGSLNAHLTIKLKEDKDYIPLDNYKDYQSITELYSNNIKIGISTCNDGINNTDVDIIRYENTDNGVVLRSEVLESSKSNTYCLWTWLDEYTPNEVQNTYFVANLDFYAEYLP